MPHIRGAPRIASGLEHEKRQIVNLVRCVPDSAAAATAVADAGSCNISLASNSL